MTNKKQLQYLRELYEAVEKDLMNCEVQLFFYQKEYDNPTHIGKVQAGEAVDTYQKRIQYLKENLQAYTLYAKEKLNEEL